MSPANAARASIVLTAFLAAAAGCSGAVAPAAGPLGWSAHSALRLRPDTTGGSGGYSPAQIRHAYGFDKVGAQGGLNEVIAIVDVAGSPTIQADLAAFSQAYNVPYTASGPTATLTVINSGGAPIADPDWAVETSLDVEWAHAVAPNAQILLVVAPTASLADLLNAVDVASHAAVNGHPVHQVSMSWGGAEFPSEASFDSHFTTSGVAYFASSGDNGAAANFPAISPNVVAVGGTTLNLDAAGNVTSETGWSGSGGGTSAVEPEPTWQQVVQTSGHRQVPDVAYDADPATGFPVYCAANGWIVVGGTSAGAPQWAAFFALVNAQRTTPLNGADASLYTLRAATYFRDVTAGSNGLYRDATGYDEVTGLGTPLGAALLPALVGTTPTPTPTPAPKPTPTPTPAPKPTPTPTPAPKPTPTPSPTPKPLATPPAPLIGMVNVPAAVGQPTFLPLTIGSSSGLPTASLFSTNLQCPIGLAGKPSTGSLLETLTFTPTSADRGSRGIYLLLQVGSSKGALLVNVQVN